MMKHPLLAVVLTLSLLAVAMAQSAGEAPAAPKPAPAPAPAGTYQIDPPHASIGFVVTHLGISEIAGKFNEVAGRYTLGDQPSFEAVIQVASVDTGVEDRDNHLRSDDFFKAQTHPTIEFRSTRVTRDGNVYTAVGDFTMNGQTHEITLPLRYLGAAEMHGQRTGFAGELTIDRREWGLTAWQGMVGNEIRLKVSFEGIRQE